MWYDPGSAYRFYYQNLHKHMADTPAEIKYTVLKPLQKLNKAKGPPSNLRPLLSL